MPQSAKIKDVIKHGKALAFCKKAAVGNGGEIPENITE